MSFDLEIACFIEILQVVWFKNTNNQIQEHREIRKNRSEIFFLGLLPLLLSQLATKTFTLIGEQRFRSSE